MAVSIGRLTEFNSKQDSITAYIEQIKLYFEVNEVPERKQVTTFLSAMGPKTDV